MVHDGAFPALCLEPSSSHKYLTCFLHLLAHTCSILVLLGLHLHCWLIPHFFSTFFWKVFLTFVLLLLLSILSSLLMLLVGLWALVDHSLVSCFTACCLYVVVLYARVCYEYIIMTSTILCDHYEAQESRIGGRVIGSGQSNPGLTQLQPGSNPGLVQ